MKEEKAFTLSEVVITMIIIGVITALTMPMLHNNASDKKWNVAKQKAQSTIGEAFKLLTVSGEITDKLTTAEFAEKIIPRYLKVEKLCGIGAEAAAKCGFKTTIKTPQGSNISLPLQWSTSTYAVGVTGNPNANGVYTSNSNTNNLTVKNYNNSYFFRTLDGFSVNFFYNPYCSSSYSEKNYLFNNGDYQPSVLDLTCLMGVYDMNGTKGPNQVGKDIGFIGTIYNSYSVQAAAVLPHHKDVVAKNASSKGTTPVEKASYYCNELDKDKNWKLPTTNELMLIYLNRNISGISSCSNALGFLSNQSLNSIVKINTRSGYWGNGFLGYDGWNVSTIYCARCVRANTLK